MYRKWCFGQSLLHLTVWRKGIFRVSPDTSVANIDLEDSLGDPHIDQKAKSRFPNLISHPGLFGGILNELRLKGTPGPHYSLSLAYSGSSSMWCSYCRPPSLSRALLRVRHTIPVRLAAIFTMTVFPLRPPTAGLSVWVKAWAQGLFLQLVPLGGPWSGPALPCVQVATSRAACYFIFPSSLFLLNVVHD